MSTTKKHYLSNILILGDVINFSLLSQDHQEQIVFNLWKYIDEHEFLKEKTVHLNGTGDGILLGIDDDSTRSMSTLEFTRNWIDFMKSSEPCCNLRVALHLGNYAVVDTEACGKKLQQIVGKGPNDIARLVDYAGEDNILVSEKLFKLWFDQEGDVINSNFNPGANTSDTFVMYAKHNLPFYFRFHNDGDDEKLPQRLQLYNAVDEYLYGHLQEINDHIIALIQEYDSSLDYQKLKPRISIFAPRPKLNSDELGCSPYRYQKDRIAEAKSKTIYRFIENGEKNPTHQPLGSAFAEKKPYFLGIKNNHYEDDFNAYCKELSESSKIPINRIKKFSRPPMAIMAIPFGIFIDESDGVICIDLDNNLSSLNETAIQSIMQEILLSYDEIISYLWNLRI